jgi:membrane protein implicated in regulation of membrane protease activity
METFFLACFVFGLLFTLASLVLGGVGHLGGHVGHVGHASHAHAPTHASGSTHTLEPKSTPLPLVNASSVIGALTWFGAAGYVLTRLGDWAIPAIILVALIAGAAGWYIIARFLGFLLKGEVVMNDEDYRLEGTVGKITVGIPTGGTGEVVFSKAGTRRSEAARGVNGEAIPRGSEVVITSYAHGFATVQPWNEFLAEHDQSRLAAGQSGEA